MADGSVPAAVVLPVAEAGGAALARPGLTATVGPDGSFSVRGSVGPILSGAVVALVVAPVSVDGSERWLVLEQGAGIQVEPTPSFDPSRRTATWHVDGVTVAPDGELLGARTEEIRDLAIVHAAAEAVGGARWCLDTGAEQGRTREQFGRPIGQFQGVKHRLADMLASVEQSVAATWDAAQVLDLEAHGALGAGHGSTTPQSRLAVQVAGALALDSYVEAAKGAIQVLGGMGFTWEHDAHIHLRRSTSLRQLLGGTAPLRAEAARLALTGARRQLQVELPAEADGFRAELEPLVADIAAIADAGEQRHRLADAGLLAPHWPAPWGRDAGAVEQLVIDEAVREGRASTPQPGRGGVGPSHHHRPRHRGTGRAVGRSQFARGPGVVPAVQRARCRFGPGRASAPGPSKWRAAGPSPGRRCGPPWPPGPTSGSAWPAPIPMRPSTRGSPTSWST